MNLPSGTITFLFTDIAGSTRLWQEHPQRMPSVLARHDQLLRQTIEHNNGSVVKTIGDAFMAVFSTAHDGVNAALTAQLSLCKEPWPAETPIRVRMGLHTGVAEERDNDYFGHDVNRAGRIQSVAHPQQIVLSQSVYELIKEAPQTPNYVVGGGGAHLPEAVTLLDLGQHQLKDLRDPQNLWQLCHPDLPVSFPPLNSLTHLPNNLPRQLSSFVGREREIDQVQELLTRCPCLTLTGSGGCGKTRLALQVAAEMQLDFPHGVWLVELASLSEPALVPQTVASALGLREEAGRSMTQTLVEYARSRTMLLLLDNCEHLLDACARLTDTLLRSCPPLKILTTSREPLTLNGEQTYHVPSLSLPDPKQPQTSVTLQQYEAALLFVERATAVKADFVVTNANASVLASVCQRLDGIPLAIELAAARVRSLSVEEINHRLDNRFRLLTGGKRVALPRHQTLRALIDWSYDLLTDQEKTLLQRLSVFAGGWTLQDAEQVCALQGRGKREEGREGQALGEEKRQEEDSALRQSKGRSESGALFPLPSSLFPDVSLFPDEVLDLLTSLSDKSLVIAETHGDTTRYRLLETVRQYARERLAESGQTQVLRERHRDYFLKLAQEIAPKLHGSEQAHWLEVLEQEHDDLRQVWTFCIEEGEPEGGETGLRLAVALWLFWDIRGHLSEGRERLSAVLSHPGAKEPTKVRADALNSAAVLAWRQGDYTAARSQYEESVTLYRELGNKQGIASALNNLGLVAQEQGDYASARSQFEECLTIQREQGYKNGIAVVLNNLGNVTREQGDYALARTQYEESVTLFQELGNKLGIAYSLNNLGIVAKGQGDYTAARSQYEESLTLYRELGNKQGIASTLNNLGTMASDKGDYTSALSQYEESLTLFQELGNKLGIANTLHNLGTMASDKGDYAAAHSQYEESLTLYRELGSKQGIAGILGGFASLAVTEQKAQRSARLWGASLVLREALDLPLPLNEQQHQEDAFAAIEKALGQPAFTLALEEGRAMTMEQAMEYALEKTEK